MPMNNSDVTTRKRLVIVEVPGEVHKALKLLSVARDEPMSEIVRRAIRQVLEQESKSA